MLTNLKIGIDNTLELDCIGVTTDYLDLTYQKLLYSQIGGCIKNISHKGNDVTIKINQPRSNTNYKFKLKTDLLILNYFKNSKFKYFGLHTPKNVSDSEISFTYSYKNKKYLIDLLEELIFSLYKKNTYSGFFYLSDRIFKPNTNNFIWEKISPFNIKTVNSNVNNYNELMKKGNIDITCHSQFDQLKIVDENFSKIYFELPLVMMLNLADNVKSLPLSGITNSLSGLRNIRQHSGFWPFQNSNIFKNYFIANQEIELLYSNYYPNKIIIEKIKSILIKNTMKVNLIEVNYRKLIKMEPTGNQVILTIIAANNKNPALFYLKLLQYMNKSELRNKCSKCLEDYLMNENMNELIFIEEMEQLLTNYNKFIPLGTMCNTQWVNKTWETVWSKFSGITNFGNLIIS